MISKKEIVRKLELCLVTNRGVRDHIRDLVTGYTILDINISNDYLTNYIVTVLKFTSILVLFF